MLRSSRSLNPNGERRRAINTKEEVAMRGMIIAGLLAVTPAYACEPFPYCLGNGGLELQYCLPGNLICRGVKAIAYGDVCYGDYAKDHADRLQSQYVSGVWHSYAWRCGGDWKKFSELPPAPESNIVLQEPTGKSCEPDVFRHDPTCEYRSANSLLLGHCQFRFKSDHSCGGEELTPDGSIYDREASENFPDCPQGMSFGEIIQSKIECKIPANQLELKQIGGGAD